VPLTCTVVTAVVAHCPFLEGLALYESPSPATIRAVSALRHLTTLRMTVEGSHDDDSTIQEKSEALAAVLLMPSLKRVYLRIAARPWNATVAALLATSAAVSTIDTLALVIGESRRKLSPPTVPIDPVPHATVFRHANHLTIAEFPSQEGAPQRPPDPSPVLETLVCHDDEVVSPNYGRARYEHFAHGAFETNGLVDWESHAFLTQALQLGHDGDPNAVTAALRTGGAVTDLSLGSPSCPWSFRIDNDGVPGGFAASMKRMRLFRATFTDRCGDSSAPRKPMLGGRFDALVHLYIHHRSVYDSASLASLNTATNLKVLEMTGPNLPDPSIVDPANLVSLECVSVGDVDTAAEWDFLDRLPALRYLKAGMRPTIVRKVRSILRRPNGSLRRVEHLDVAFTSDFTVRSLTNKDVATLLAGFDHLQHLTLQLGERSSNAGPYASFASALAASAATLRRITFERSEALDLLRFVNSLPQSMPVLSKLDAKGSYAAHPPSESLLAALTPKCPRLRLLGTHDWPPEEGSWRPTDVSGCWRPTGVEVAAADANSSAGLLGQRMEWRAHGY